MSKTQWKNLYHSFRFMHRKATLREALIWASNNNYQDYLALKKVIG